MKALLPFQPNAQLQLKEETGFSSLSIMILFKNIVGDSNGVMAF